MPVQTLGEQEIIILVDCSGSMTYGSKYVKAYNAARGAARSLQQSRHRVAVYGHTADLELFGQMSGLVIYKFKDFDDSTGTLDHRITTVNKVYSLANNDDAGAIEYIGAKFSSRPNKKTLIVISDGSPASHRIGTWDGIEKTKLEVDKLRANGINVLSISIDKDAINPNNEIYGTDNNTANNDPNVVATLIDKICSI